MKSGADVVIVGAGPAGIATAIAASTKGFRVTVIDSRKPPIDKACGEGLLPEGVAALGTLGIELDSRRAFPFSGFRFTDDESSATAKFTHGRAFGIRRTTLHQLLIERANEVGVSFVWNSRVSNFEQGRLRVNGRTLAYKWLVGADGQHSTVRKWTGLDSRWRGRSRFGFRRHFSIAPWSDVVEVHWGHRCQVFVTPTSPGEICLGLLSDRSRFRIDDALAVFPELRKRLAGVLPATAELGNLTALRPARAVVRGRVALVGDASSTVDGIAGKGLSLAFQQALLLAEAIAQDNPSHYAAAHRRIAAPAERITRLLLLLDRNAWLRRKTLRLFEKRPALFSKLISGQIDAADPQALKPSDIFTLGLQVLRA
ncbi:MAG: FAD-dependent oxidoreductase [Candidatus Acidiferrales bacterium]